MKRLSFSAIFAFLFVSLFLVQSAFADAACEKGLMGAGAAPLLANKICTLSPANVTATATVQAEQLTSTDDATVTDDLGVGGDIAVTGAGTFGGATVNNAKTLKLDVGTIAAAGANQGAATAIVDQVTYITASDNAKGVVLPAAAATAVGTVYDLFNTVASKTVLVYPGASGNINAVGANTAVPLYGLQGMRCTYSAANVWQCGTLGNPSDKTVFIPAGIGRAGAKAGWVNTGTNINEATVAASQSAATFTLPVGGLELGDTIVSYKVIGQIESAGGAVTLDADLRMLTNAAADPADASLGAITQVSKTADYKVADAKTLATAELIDSGDMPYVLLTATTAGSTDIRLLGVEVVVRRQN